MENSLAVPQKVNDYNMTQQFQFWVYIQKNWKQVLKYMYLCVCVYVCVDISSIHNDQNRKTAQISINVWMDKQTAVYTCNRILCSYKKERSTEICFNMEELWNIRLSEKSQTQKVTYCAILFIENIQNK